MLISSIKTCVVSIFLLLFSSNLLFAQNYSQPEYRRISVTLSGGASLGDMNRGNYFMSSNFSVNTKDTPTFGVGLQYALTPAWSFELGYRHAQIKGVSKPFEAGVNMASLKSIINLNQLFFVNRISNRLNPFLSAGIGYDIFSYEGADESYDYHNTSYNAGAGLAFKLTNTVDLFAHYEYHMGSNAMDNNLDGYGADLINSLTGGIRINFGKKGRTLASWREAPMDLSRSEYDRLMAQASQFESLRQMVENMEQKNQEQDTRITAALDEKSDQIDSLTSRIDQMTSRMRDLRNALSELQLATRKVKMDTETGFTTSLPKGYYVQIFAAKNLSQARDMRKNAIESMSGVVANAEQKVFVIHRKEFYEVMIGLFGGYDEARQVQEVMQPVYSDAYVIEFPRPVNLLTDFEGLEVLREINRNTDISMSND